MIDLYNGDCLEIIKTIPDNSIDLTVTDPPYLCDYSRHDKNSRFSKLIKNDENNEENEEMIKSYIKECYRIMKENTALYMFCNYKKVDFFIQEIRKYFNFKNLIIWDKGSVGMGDLETTYGYSYEFIIYATKGQPKIRGKRIADVWRFNRVLPDIQIHQNQKPVELLEQCILKSSNKNDIVFDGFMGSGSTGVASLMCDRSFIGIELDNIHFNNAKKRIEDEQAQGKLF